MKKNLVLNSTMFSKSNDIWNSNNFNGINRIGSMSYLYTLLCPISYADFAQKYFNSGEERKEIAKRRNLNYKDDSQHGRTKAEIIQLTQEFLIACQKSGDDIFKEMDFEEAYRQVMQRIIIETFNGHAGERVALQRLNELFQQSKFTCQRATAKEDAEFAVDLIIKKGDHTVVGVQVKPESYLHKKYKEGKNDQAALNKKKNELFSKHYAALLPCAISNIRNPKVIYLYYNNQHQFTNYQDVLDEVALWK